MQDAMNNVPGYSQNGQYMECQQCGEMLRMHYSADGLSGHSDSHRCGPPSIQSVRRIIREEIEAAFKRMGLTPQP